MTFVKKEVKKRFLGFITLKVIHNKSSDSCGITSALHHCIQNSLSIRAAAAGFLCCLRSRSHHKSHVSGGWEGGSFAFRVYHELAGVVSFKRLLIFTSISDPQKTVAFAWEGPDL